MNDARNGIGRSETEAYLAHAMELADEARRVIRAARARGVRIERKPDGTFVTSADIEVETRLRALVLARYPDHGVIGEEQAPSNPGADFQWIMDPIDGTEDFAFDIPTFGCILALHYRGQPLVGVIDHPALDLRVNAAYGLGAYRNGERVRPAWPATPAGAERVMLSARANFTRYMDDGHLFDAVARAFPNHRIYRTCFAHTCVAIGAADAGVEYHDRPWDLAASRLLVEEAGGQFALVRDLALPGVGRILSAVFGRPALVERLAALLR